MLLCWGGASLLQVERLLDFALGRHGQLEAYILERAQLVEAAVPRVKDFVEFDQLLRQLVHFVPSARREVAVRCCIFAFDFVRHPHEGEAEVAVEAGFALAAVLGQLQHRGGRVEARVHQHGVRVALKLVVLHCHSHQ